MLLDRARVRIVMKINDPSSPMVMQVTLVGLWDVIMVAVDLNLAAI